MVTVKIDERTKDGKALLDFLENYSERSSSIKILLPASKVEEKENVPNAKTISVFQETDEGVGLEKFEDLDALFEDLES